ncbi:MAG: hypothetical protein A2W28_03855 [Gammaproteobacteria bacterium RBG_16_51_14]|nr:MAG: hypothetical protein A2W28_03855 [Gammaproteobacteria bacterium RBG_16_51_14]
MTLTITIVVSKYLATAIVTMIQFQAYASNTGRTDGLFDLSLNNEIAMAMQWNFSRSLDYLTIEQSGELHR